VTKQNYYREPWAWEWRPKNTLKTKKIKIKNNIFNVNYYFTPQCLLFGKNIKWVYLSKAKGASWSK